METRQRVRPMPPSQVRHARRLAVLFALSASFIAAPFGMAASRRPLTGRKWVDMDYGPFKSGSLEVAGGNIARKGIAIRVDPGEGGVSSGNEFLLFETDTLRYAAGWTGPEFQDWHNITLDGRHGGWPKILGHIVFANPDAPGWADARGNFDDTRFVGLDKGRYGPMDHAVGHWKGLYLHGNDVVLSYTVGDTKVLELPGAEGAGTDRAFTRTFNIGPRSRDLIVQVAHQPDNQPQLRTVDNLASTNGRVAVFRDNGKGAGENNVTVAAVVGGPAGTQWISTPDGHLRLRIPAGPEPTRLKLLIAQVAKADNLASFTKRVRATNPPRDLTPLTRGGPKRWKETLTTQVKPLGRTDGPFAVDAITTPLDNPYHSWMRLGGFDFFKDGRRAAVCTWMGDVWLVDGLGGEMNEVTWQRIATGLYEPLGVKIVDETIYVTCRDQITRLHDLNGDGEIDYYENFNNDALAGEHYHEFTMALQTDADGNFYYTKAAGHDYDAKVPHQGSLMKVSKDGSSTSIVAYGFRAPNGLLVNDDGSFILSDQEGHWTPKNRINWVKPGGFYGYMRSYYGLTERSDRPDEYDPPICWIPNYVDRSPAEQVRVTSDKWGPLKGQLLSLSYGTGKVLLVMVEHLKDTVQGGVVRLPLPDFPTGIMRGRFHSGDGQLYVCGLFGWSSDRTVPGGFFRIRYTGKPVHLPEAINVKPNGIAIRFTRPLNRTAAEDIDNYAVEQWNYRRVANYGSEHYSVRNPRRRGQDEVEVVEATLSADGRTVFLELEEVIPVMQMKIEYTLEADDGTPLRQTIHNTINGVPDE